MKKALLALAIATTLATPSAFAGSGLTGTYSCIANNNWAPTLAAVSGSGIGTNFLFTLNFSSFTTAIVAQTSNNFNTNTSTTAVSSGTGTFSEVSGPVTGVYTETLSVSGSTLTFNILPANSNNTLLVERADTGAYAPATGVCQKQ
jgi:hypothetical protein